MPIKFIYKSATEQDRIQNGAKAFENFINNGFKSMGVSHRVEVVNVVSPPKIQYSEISDITALMSPASKAAGFIADNVSGG